MNARDVPAPAGRDLTAQDVRDTLAGWEFVGDVDRQYAADHLTEIARPSGGVGQPDTAGPLRRGLRAALGIDDDVQVDDDGLIKDVAEWIRQARAFAPEPVAAGSMSPDDAPTTEPQAAELLTLDELTTAVENAFDCAAIEVQVWETDTTGARTIESPHPMYRLARCLRSYGLLDERRDRGEDAGDDTTETHAEWRVYIEGVTGDDFYPDQWAAQRRAKYWHERGLTGAVAESRTVSTTTRTTAWKAEQ